MTPSLTICTVNYNTAHFLELMLLSFDRLTDRPWKMLICDNGSASADLAALHACCKSYPQVEIFERQQAQQASIEHAKALDFLIAQVDTPYFLTMDADCIFLRKHWDTLLLAKLDETTACVGTPAVPNTPKETDFPNVFAVLYDTDIYRSLGSPSFSPDPNWLALDDKNGIKAKDTGWIVREKYQEAGYAGFTLDCRVTRHHRSQYFKIICAEYYLPDDEQIVCCHFSRGSTKGEAKYLFHMPLLYTLPYIGPRLLKRRCERDVHSWIQSARDIILHA